MEPSIPDPLHFDVMERMETYAKQESDNAFPALEKRVNALLAKTIKKNKLQLQSTESILKMMCAYIEHDAVRTNEQFDGRELIAVMAHFIK